MAKIRQANVAAKKSMARKMININENECHLNGSDNGGYGKMENGS